MVVESSVAGTSHSPPVLAVFDLDGTLTHRDTLLPFLLFVAGPGAFMARLLRSLPALIGLVLRVLPRDRAKESVLRVFLAGMPIQDLERRGRVFAARCMPRMIRPEALAQLAWHRTQGHRCVLLSASPAVYAEPWARRAGFDHVVATELQRDRNGCITGRLAGRNCRGTEKVRRMEAHFGNLGGFVIHGYGDSHADRAFLDRCTVAHFRPFRDAPSMASRRNRPADLVRLMRPHQWIKNLFVFTGLVFGHAWYSGAFVAGAVLAAAAFSLTASAVYIINDWLDRERDRLHPTKRDRPLAARRVTQAAAFSLSALLLATGGALALAASPRVAALVSAYVAINLAYSLALKNVVIVDVFLIAAGFMLRILAGTLGIGILPSQWLLFCGFLLTLFLGFAKRRAELLALPPGSLGHRRSLAEYSGASLDQLIAICAGGVIMSYSLYTMSPDTIRVHGTGGLIYTVPFVVFGVFRYLHLLHRRQGGADTARDLARDRYLQACVAGWAAATLLLIA